MDHDGAGRDNVDELLQRQSLFERLARIQHSISHHAPLQDVLDSITAGACELLGDEVVGLRLIDEDNPAECIIVSAHGVKASLFETLRRSRVGDGAGGVAISENRLVVVEDYKASSVALSQFVEDGLQAAMAAPVHESGRPVGSLAVASYSPGRRYSKVEQDVLLAFARHASLAVNDAKLFDAMREAQHSKEMFFAMVSHELKTPLAAIVGNLHTLMRHKDTIDKETRDNMVATAKERAQQLTALINRLLAGARAELAAAKQDTFLPDLVSEAIKGFRESGRLRVLTIPEILLRVDAQAVREVVGIFLENAVSHAGPDTDIELEGSVDADRVSLAVRNSGALPEGVEASVLFHAFRQGSRDSGGVGLGLYIASRLARSIGGEIRASSHEGTVEFKLTWPQEPAENSRVDRQQVNSE